MPYFYNIQAFDIKLLNCRCHTFTPEGPGKPGFPCGPGGPWKQRRTWLRNTQSKGDHWGHWTGLHFSSEVGVGYYFMLGTRRCIHTLFPFHCLFVLWDRSCPEVHVYVYVLCETYCVSCLSVCLSKLRHMDVIFLIPTLFHWFLGSHNVKAAQPSHHLCQKFSQNGPSPASQFV